MSKLKLEEIQKEIDKNQGKLEKLQKEIISLQEQFEKATEEKKTKDLGSLEKKQKAALLKQNKISLKNNKLGNDLTERRKLIDGGLSTLPDRIQQAELSPTKNSNKQEKELLGKLKDNLGYAKEEIREYEKYENQKRLKQEKLEKEAKLNAEETYQKEKKNLYDILGGVLGNDERLKNLLINLVPKGEEEQTGIKTGQAVLGGIGFALTNLGTVFNVLGSRSFLTEEGTKLADVLSGKTELDPNNPPFFLRVLQDKDTLEFFQKNPKKFGNLLDKVLPEIIPVIFAELGKVDALEKDMAITRKKLVELNHERDALVREKDKLFLTGGTLDPEVYKKKMGELEQKIEGKGKEITTLRDKTTGLANKLQLAHTIKVINESGLGDQYIKEKLLPIITGTLKGMLVDDPKTFLEIANLTIKMLSTKDDEEKNKILGEILGKVNVEKILKDANISTVLANEGEALSKLAVTTLKANGTLQGQAKKYKVPEKLVGDLVPAVTNILSSVVKNPTAIAKLYDALKPIILDDTAKKLNKKALEENRELTVEEKAKISKKRTENILAFANNLPGLLLEKDIFESVRKNLPEILKHKEDLAKIAGAVCEQEPLKTRLAKAGISPKLIEEVMPALLDTVNNSLPLVTDLATKLLENTELLTGFYDNFTELQRINKELEEGELTKQQKEDLRKGIITQKEAIILAKKNLTPERIEQLIKEQREVIAKTLEAAEKIFNDIKPILEKDLPKLITENLPNLITITNKLITDGPLKKMMEDLGVTPELVNLIAPDAAKILNSALPFLTEAVSNGLVNKEKLTELYGNYTEYQLITKALTVEGLSQEEREKLTKRQQEVLEKMAEGAKDTFAAIISPILSDQLPKLLQENQQNIANIASKVLSQEPVKKLLEPLGINADLVQKILPDATAVVSSALPLVNNVIIKVMDNPKELVGVYVKFAEYQRISKELAAEGLDPRIRAELIQKQQQALQNLIADPGGKKILEDTIASVLKEDLPEFIGNNKGKLTDIVSNVVTQEPIAKILKPLGITPELVKKVMPDALDLVQSALPLAGEVVTKVAQSSEQIAGLYGGFNEFQRQNAVLKQENLSPEQRQQAALEQQKAVTGMLKNAAVVMTNITPLLEKDLPEFIGNNKGKLTDIVSNVVTQEPIAKILKPLGITPELVKKVMPDALDLVKSALPLAGEVVTKVAQSSEQIAGLYGGFNEFQRQNAVLKQENLSVEERQNKMLVQQVIVTGMISNAAAVMTNITPLLKTDLPEFIGNNKVRLTDIASNVVTQEPIAKILQPLGITPELVKKVMPDALDLVQSALPLAGEVATKVVQSSEQIADLYVGFNKFQHQNAVLKQENLTEKDREKATLKQQKAVTEMIKNAAIVMTNIAPVLEKDLPKFIEDNKGKIGGLVDSVTKNEVVATTLANLGIPPELVKNATNVGMDLATDLLPLVSKLANGALKDQEGVQDLVNQVQDVMGADETQQKDKVLKLVGSILEFKNKNPEVKAVIEKDLPDILTKHSKELGGVIDQFLNQTPMGRNLNLRGEKVLNIVAENLPQVTEVAEAFAKKQYGKMILKAIPLLFKKDVLSTLIGAGLDARRFNNEKKRDGEDRNKRAGKEVASGLDQVLSGNPTGDLGKLLEDHANHLKTDTGKYSFRSHDLNGFNFEKPLNFDNLKIDGFKFNNAKFTEASFKGCTIINCDFGEVKEKVTIKGKEVERTKIKEVEFKGPVSFDGATIDAKSLESLVPSIKKYNATHPDAPIKLDNVKVIGEVKKGLLDGISQKNMTQVKTVKEEMLEGKKDVVQDINVGKKDLVDAVGNIKGLLSKHKAVDIPKQKEESQVEKLKQRSSVAVNPNEKGL